MQDGYRRVTPGITREQMEAESPIAGKRSMEPGIILPEAELCSPDGTLWVAPGTSLMEVERCRQAGVRLTVPGTILAVTEPCKPVGSMMEREIII